MQLTYFLHSGWNRVNIELMFVDPFHRLEIRPQTNHIRGMDLNMPRMIMMTHMRKLVLDLM